MRFDRAMLFAAGLAALHGAPAAAQPAPPQTQFCAKPEYRQFDFWIGRWDVYGAGSDRLVGHSLVEKLYNGCVLRENWMGLGGSTGGSLNLYQDTTGRWRQTWADFSGNWTEYSGQRVGPDMRFLALDTDRRTGAAVVRRMTFSPMARGAVRQLIEVSADNGATWKTDSDLTYRPADAAREAR